MPTTKCKIMSNPSHYVAVFGGAVAGAESAFQMASRGIKVVVFEQQALPYGKIEDGLPKWHVKLRDKEEGKINDKMNHPNVTYVPNVRLGKDIGFEEVAREWGFTAILLATGAWDDRPLPIDGIDEYVGKGLYYQNPFINWFNHFHEPGFNGEQFEIIDGAIIVGGGLASLDVAKVLMIESVQAKLKEKGHECNMFTLDRSIAKVLEGLGLTFEDLGLEGCTLYYRRRVKDMPLSPMATDTPEKLEKAENVREKLLNNFLNKYLFKFKELHMPTGYIEEDGRLTGMKFTKTELQDGKAVAIEGSEFEVKAPLVISSIGSIPEMIDGIPSEWQSFKIKDQVSCQIDGYDNIFAIGNAVTGKGNINESLKHGRELSQRIMDEHINWKEEDFEKYLRLTESNVADQVEAITGAFSDKNLLSPEKIEEIDARVKEFQEKVGYNNDYDAWVKANLPERLEDLLGIDH